MQGDTGSDTQAMGLKDAATGVADEAGRTIESTAARGMSQAGDVLHKVAEAVRQSSETLQEEQPQVGRFISSAADKLDEAASFISDKEPTQLLEDSQQLARRQPVLVIGGGLVAGLLIGRALRSAGGQTGGGSQASSDWYGAGYQGSPHRSGVSSGYGTGYGASYDQSNLSGSRQGNGSGHLTGVMSDGGSDPAEG